MRDNSILIGKYIYRFLSNNPNIAELVSSENIFPLLGNLRLDDATGEATDVTFPFITFERTSIKPIYSKILQVADNEVTIAISCVTIDYEQSLDIANAVRDCFEGKHYSDEEITIDNIMLDDISEDYVMNAYVQHLIFKMNVRTK